MQSHKDSVLEALRQSNGERNIARYLKRNQSLILSAFAGFGNHGNYVLAEFGLGKSLWADFVVIQGSSVGWQIEFIELEPVGDLLFNKDRTPTKSLRRAQKQIADWRDYERTDRAPLRRQLADAAKRDDILKEFQGDDDDLVTLTGMRLRDPEAYVSYGYHIVIGRRELLSTTAHKLRSRSRDDDNIDIATYDRIVDAAMSLDAKDGNA